MGQGRSAGVPNEDRMGDMLSGQRQPRQRVWNVHATSLADRQFLIPSADLLQPPLRPPRSAAKPPMSAVSAMPARRQDRGRPARQPRYPPDPSGPREAGWEREEEVINADDLEMMLYAQARNARRQRQWALLTCLTCRLPPQYPDYPRPMAPEPRLNGMAPGGRRYYGQRAEPNPFADPRAGSNPPAGMRVMSRTGQPMAYPSDVPMYPGRRVGVAPGEGRLGMYAYDAMAIQAEGGRRVPMEKR